MNKEFIQAIEDLEKERHIPKDVLIEAIESALVSAYKRITAHPRMCASISMRKPEISTYICAWTSSMR